MDRYLCNDQNSDSTFNCDLVTCVLNWRLVGTEEFWTTAIHPEVTLSCCQDIKIQRITSLTWWAGDGCSGLTAWHTARSRGHGTGLRLCEGHHVHTTQRGPTPGPQLYRHDDRQWAQHEHTENVCCRHSSQGTVLGVGRGVGGLLWLFLFSVASVHGCGVCVCTCVSVLCTYGCECYCFEWVCCLKGVCVLSVCLCECVCEWVFTCVVFMCGHACFYVCCVRVQTNMCVCMSVHASTTLSNVHLYRNHRHRFWWQTLANNPKIQCSANLITGVLRGEQR